MIRYSETLPGVFVSKNASKIFVGERADIAEDLTGFRKVEARTDTGDTAEVEEKRVYLILGKKVTVTFYYSKSSVMFQGGKEAVKDLGGKTPPLWLAERVNERVIECTKNMDIKALNEKIKEDIRQWNLSKNKSEEVASV